MLVIVGFLTRTWWIIVVCIIVWLFDWLLFFTVTSDNLTLATPFVILTAVLVTVQVWKRKEMELAPALVSKPTGIVLCFLVVLAFLVGRSYPFMSWLMWNINALTTTFLAYHIAVNDALRHLSDKSAAVVDW